MIVGMSCKVKRKTGMDSGILSFAEGIHETPIVTVGYLLGKFHDEAALDVFSVGDGKRIL